MNTLIIILWMIHKYQITFFNLMYFIDAGSMVILITNQLRTKNSAIHCSDTGEGNFIL